MASDKAKKAAFVLAERDVIGLVKHYVTGFFSSWEPEIEAKIRANPDQVQKIVNDILAEAERVDAEKPNA